MEDNLTTLEAIRESLKDKKNITQKELEEIVQKLLTEEIRKQYEFMKIVEALGDDNSINNVLEEKVNTI